MRAGNDEDRRRSDQGVFPVAREPPISESQCAGHHRHVEEECGGPVGDSLRARTGCLGTGNEPHDAGESGLIPNGGNAHAKASATGNGPGNHLGTHPFRHRPGLAGDHGFIDVRSALHHSPVCRNASARAHENDVADAQFRQRNRLSL